MLGLPLLTILEDGEGSASGGVRGWWGGNGGGMRVLWIVTWINTIYQCFDLFFRRKCADDQSYVDSVLKFVLLKEEEEEF